MRKHACLSGGWPTVAFGQVADAQRLAQVLLDEPDLRRRWAHVCGVARRAAELAALREDRLDRRLKRLPGRLLRFLRGTKAG